MIGSSPEQGSVFGRRISRRSFLRGAAILSAAAFFGISPETSKSPLIDSLLMDPLSIEPLPGRIQGIHFPSLRRGEFKEQAALESLFSITEPGPNLIGFKPTLYQRDIHSTDIFPTANTSDFTDLRIGIVAAKRYLGCKTMLSPQINLLADPNHWHGEIGANFFEQDWDRWFQSYRQMIVRFAGFAQEQGVDLFVIGNEYAIVTAKRPQDWVDTIKQVRAAYQGPLTYAAHYTNEFNNINWWPEVDLIGLNPYFELSNPPSSDKEVLKANWSQIINDRILPVVLSSNKDLLFPEIGYFSADGTSQAPWDYSKITNPLVALNLKEQTACYQALYESFWQYPWWKGVVWWNWSTDPKVNGMNNKEYSPRGKDAAAVIKYYSNVLSKRAFLRSLARYVRIPGIRERLI